MATVEIRALGPGDLDLLCAAEEGLFDDPVDPVQAAAFLADPLHHMVVALDRGRIVAFASGSVLLHPDKPPAFFVNEVGTRESHLRRGLASAVTRRLFDLARDLGCHGGIWLATEDDNEAALGLYRKLEGDEHTFVAFGWDGAFDEEG
jgi:aminoglycoside 6'-N-acetyltransferase I